MRISMSVIRKEHVVYHVRKKVPRKLEGTAAQAMGLTKPRVAWLQRSLRTKDHREAKRLAPPVLMEFDRILAQAAALLAETPLRTSLDRREIERIADYFYASQLAGDEERSHGLTRFLTCASMRKHRPASRGSLQSFRCCSNQYLYFPACDCMAFSICSLTASRLKLAPFCIGGNSIAVWASFPTSCCAN